MQADERRKDLKAAVKKLQKRGGDISISAVAREVNVSPALIHNRYRDLAEHILSLNGKSTRKKSAARLDEIHRLKERLAEVSKERDELKADMKKLASLNLTLMLENGSLRAALKSKVVTPICR